MIHRFSKSLWNLHNVVLTCTDNVTRVFYRAFGKDSELKYGDQLCLGSTFISKYIYTHRDLKTGREAEFVFDFIIR